MRRLQRKKYPQGKAKFLSKKEKGILREEAGEEFADDAYLFQKAQWKGSEIVEGWETRTEQGSMRCVPQAGRWDPGGGLLRRAVLQWTQSFKTREEGSLRRVWQEGGRR